LQAIRSLALKHTGNRERLRGAGQALRTLSQGRSWSRQDVLGAISWAFIAKRYQNLQKLTFD
jgi:hypothetical protein